MNKRLNAKHHVVFLPERWAMKFDADSFSQIQGIELAGKILGKKVHNIQIPLTVNPSWEIRMNFTDGSYLEVVEMQKFVSNQTWGNNTTFYFFFIPDDWQKVMETQK